MLRGSECNMEMEVAMMVMMVMMVMIMILSRLHDTPGSLREAYVETEAPEEEEKADTARLCRGRAGLGGSTSSRDGCSSSCKEEEEEGVEEDASGAGIT